MSKDAVAAIKNDAVAVIGMSCRLPGKSNNPRQFWDFLMNEGDGIVDVPADRWDAQAYFDADPSVPNKMYVKRGGFIEQIEQFDPQFFGISPKEAPHIDPQHRWLLELAYEAMENAGLKAGELKGSDTAVFIGQFMHDYEQIQLDPRARGEIASHSATGPSMTLTANRISYCFDFNGPSVTLDTACSSSLVALDMACKAILNGDSQLAIAGGVNILLRPELTMSICKASMLSPDMQCKSFDAAANGYVRSEGAALVMLKSLAQAEADGDPVLAVIRATGINQDGQTAGITVPSGAAQQMLLKKTLKLAGFDSAEIQYAEAHGTGTAVGDPIEVNALGATLGQRPQGVTPCVIGSVKSNIGHTEATAGAAALIKTIMAMNHGVIPKNIHLHNVNPAIDLQALNVRLADQHQPWPDVAGQTRKAVVNSFGFGGTNANAVLEQAPARNKTSASYGADSYFWLPLSGKSEKSLQDNAANYLAFLNQTDASLADIAFSAATKREHFRFRAVVSGHTLEEMQQGLADLAANRPGNLHVQGKVLSEIKGRRCFVFSGMGTTWAGMGKKLYETEAVFRAALDRCDAALRPLTGWSLVEHMLQTEDQEKVHQTNIAQPAIFASQVALAELLASQGVVPDAIVGHSAGEVAASYIAGALSFDDAITVIYHRSRLQHTTEGMGKMLAVALTEAALQPYLAGQEHKVSIAAINSEDALTLSGDAEVLQHIANQLDEQGIFARFLKVAVPYHSPVMDSLKQDLLQALQNIVPRQPHTPLYSTVTGKLCDPSDAKANFGAAYWPENVRLPVYFKQAIDQIAAAGFDTFIEVAPHTALASSIKKNLEAAQKPALVVTTMKREQNDALMLNQTIAALHVAGVALDWQRLSPQGAQFVQLPNYAWQHASYWHENEQVQLSRIKNQASRNGFTEAGHILLGSKLNSPAAIWQTEIDLQKLPFLADHQIEQEIVYPGAAYIEQGLALAKSLGRQSLVLENIQFHRALFLDKNRALTMECTLDPTSLAYQISALDLNSAQWQVVSSGSICEQAATTLPKPFALAGLQQKLDSKMEQAAFYQHCHQLGLEYQPRFQAVQQCWHSQMESLVELQLPAVLAGQMDDYALHPSLLDGALQSLFPTVNGGYLPVEVGQLQYYQKPGMHCYAYLNTLEKTADFIRGDIFMLDENGYVLVALRDIAVKSSKTRTRLDADAALYDYTWQARELTTSNPAASTPAAGTWLLFADRGGVAQQLMHAMQQQGQTVVLIEQGKAFDQTSDTHFRTSLDTPESVLPVLQQFAASAKGIIYGWAMDSIDNDCQHATLSVMNLAQAMDQVNWASSQRLFMLTRQAQQVANEVVQPAGAALWGLSRVFGNEHQEYHISLIDLAATPDASMISALNQEILSADYEQEVALRAEGRMVHRLRRLEEAELASYLQGSSQLDADANWALQLQGEAGHLSATRAERVAPAAKQVGLQILHAGFDRHSLDQWQNGSATLQECSAVVTSLGAGVSEWQIGDQVFGFAPASYAAHSNASAATLVRRPANMASDLAASLPGALISAEYCLQQLAGVKAGSAILIHDADRLQGQLLLQMAHKLGVQVYASAASTSARTLLKAQGVRAVFDNQHGEFARQIMQLTEGRGLDAVFNTLGGQLRLKSLGVLAAFGHFIDLEATTAPLDAQWATTLAQKALSYHAFQVSTLLALDPARAMSRLQRALSLLPEFEWASLNVDSLACHSDSAVRTALAESKSGKLSLDFQQRPQHIGQNQLSQPVRANASYMVTGGLGGLGLEMMQWLAAQGAQSIVLLGRRAANGEALAQIEQVRATGVQVTVMQADIGIEADVARVFADISANLPPLAGIIHSAGVLDDGVLMQQSAARFEKVLAPKVKGAWYLHQHSSNLPLDFFIMFSSIAAIIGWPGQSNYAAANAFMDALAQHRQARGLPALSINWGPWRDAGMAANLDQRDSERMSEAGMAALSGEQGLHAMSRLLAYRLPQAGVFDLEWSSISKTMPDPARLTVFKQFIDPNLIQQSVNLFDQLMALDMVARGRRLGEEICVILAEVLGIDNPGAIDPAQSVFEFGLNSLMGMDFKNRLQGKLHTKLPTTLVLKYPTVQAMVQFICENHLMDQIPAGNEADRITLVL